VEARNNTKEAKKYIEICVSARALTLLGQAEHLESLAVQGRLLRYRKLLCTCRTLLVFNDWYDWLKPACLACFTWSFASS
jgi:hypothetical protein